MSLCSGFGAWRQEETLHNMATAVCAKEPVTFTTEQIDAIVAKLRCRSTPYIRVCERNLAALAIERQCAELTHAAIADDDEPEFLFLATLARAELQHIVDSSPGTMSTMVLRCVMDANHPVDNVQCASPRSHDVVPTPVVVTHVDPVPRCVAYINLRTRQVAALFAGAIPPGVGPVARTHDGRFIPVIALPWPETDAKMAQMISEGRSFDEGPLPEQLATLLATRGLVRLVAQGVTAGEVVWVVGMLSLDWVEEELAGRHMPAVVDGRRVVYFAYAAQPSRFPTISSRPTPLPVQERPVHLTRVCDHPDGVDSKGTVQDSGHCDAASRQ